MVESIQEHGMNITPEDKLGDIIARYPNLTSPLEDWGLDFCCGGQKSLQTASAEKGLEVGTVVALLNRTAARGVSSPVQEPTADNPAEYDTAKLISHIKYVHHNYLRKVLPDLKTLAAKVTAAHSMTSPQLFQVEAVVRTLAKELADHLDVEEKDLFPKLEQGEDLGSVGALISELEAEHQGAGKALEDLRTLTGDYAIPAWACMTYRRFMSLLKEFEQEMHRHVHLENSVLFPRFR